MKPRDIPTAVYLANSSYKGQSWRRDVDLLLTNTQASADRYAHTQGYQVAPIGVFIDEASVTAPHKTRERVLFVNPSRQKGVGIVIQLALLLEARRPDIVFEVVESRGSWQEALKQFSRDLGHPRDALRNVVTTPNTADMRPVYGRARLLLAPSLCWETAGRVIAEAMLNGIPAIVTDRGGMPEMLQSGGIKLQLPSNCYKAPYNVLPAMALLEPVVAAIIRLYDDKPFYDHYVARATQVGKTSHGLGPDTARLVKALARWVEQRAGDLPTVPKTEVQAGSIPN